MFAGAARTAADGGSEQSNNFSCFTYYLNDWLVQLGTYLSDVAFQFIGFRISHRIVESAQANSAEWKREEKNTKFKLMKAKNASSTTTEKKTESFRGYLQAACVQPKETNGLQRTRHTSIQIVGGHEYDAKSFFLFFFISFNPNQWNSHHYSRSSTSSSSRIVFGTEWHEWTSSALAHTP